MQQHTIMYPVSVYLARRPPETVKVYCRGLKLFADHVNVSLDTLHDYIGSPREKIVGDILTFGDTLSNFNQNTQRLYVSCVMSYLSYNEVIIPKTQRRQAVPKPGDLFRDKAFTIEEVRRIYEFLPAIGRAALLLMFCTGMRISEIISFKESDIEGRIIHLKAIYCKGDHGRDVVMTSECQSFLNDIWLPQRQKYIDIAVTRSTQRGGKSAIDDRVIPCNKATLYEIMMLGFRKAGLGAQKDDRNLYHPHGLRKSFRSIVGAVNPDLSELLMGHNGYLSRSYVRLDILKEYGKIEHLVSLGSTEGTKNKLRLLEEDNKALKEQLQILEQRQQATLATEKMVAEMYQKFQEEKRQTATAGQ
jgi:integrase